MIRLPAEWEPQSAIMLTWPYAGSIWDYQLAEAEQTWLNIAEAILQDQNLIVSCQDAARLETLRPELQQRAQKYGTQAQLYHVAANDVWARDHGPIGVIEDGQLVLLDFQFNAWGNKYPCERDDLIPSRLHALGAFPGSHMRRVDLILEGGSIESDGHGTLLTTEHCLLSKERNHELSKIELEMRLQRALGVKRVLWLANGELQGDDTDGHIDTLARFCDANTICYVQCQDPRDPHYLALDAMEHELKQFVTYEGEPYRLIPLPMPEPIIEKGRRLAATYANFLITNHAVVMPVYGVPQDTLAIEQLASCFPGRVIRTVNCRALIRQNGSLHCVTMQIHDGGDR